MNTMNKHTTKCDAAHYEQRAAIMKAMAHPSRLMMVDALAHGEQCVCDLTTLVGHDISTVSKHLSILKNAGIVEDEKRGKNVYYSLKVPCVLTFFHCMESVLKAGGQ
jgi:ArsR family transcriptional regulator